MNKTIKKLEDKLEAYFEIIEIPLTFDVPTYREAVSNFNMLQLLYKVKTGETYIPK